MFPFSALQLRRGARPTDRVINFPEYGSEAFRSLLKEAANLTSEVAVVLTKLSLRCTFDRDYVTTEAKQRAPGLCIGFHNAVIHLASDSHGVSRIGSGCISAFLVDESLKFSSVLSVGDMASQSNSWADLRFGLDQNRQPLPKGQPQAFQLSVFMTPGWSGLNLGMDTPLITLSDFSPVFKFLAYVSSYFSDCRFENPSFEAADRAKRIKEELSRMLKEDLSNPEKCAKKSSIIVSGWHNPP